MSLKNPLHTNLDFAILPVFIPLNPVNGTIVKVKKKAEGSVISDIDESIDKNIDQEIDPLSIFIVRGNLNIRVIESNKKGIINSSGYHLFLNLPKSQGHTIELESNTYINFKNYIDFIEYDPDRKQTTPEFSEGTSIKNRSPDRSIIVYPIRKQLLNTISTPSTFIKGIVVYPSKKTILKVILRKLQLIDFNFDLHEKPITNANVFLKKKYENASKESSDKSKISSTNEMSDVYEFSKLDSLKKVSVVEGSYDELEYSPLRAKEFINFEDQDKGKFYLVIKDGNGSSIEMKLEVKIEKGMTTLLNVLIIE